MVSTRLRRLSVRLRLWTFAVYFQGLILRHLEIDLFALDEIPALLASKFNENTRIGSH